MRASAQGTAGQPSAAPSSDRLFLEEACPSLLQELREQPIWLAQQLKKNADAKVYPFHLQDFEVAVEISSVGPEIMLQVAFPYLKGVMDNGSASLLNEVTAGLPIRGVKLSADSGELVLALNAVEVVENEVLREKCAEVLSKVRSWLFIGPLVQRLRWLRDAVAKCDEAAKKAVPGNAKATAAAAMGTPPPIIQLQVRRSETIWIVTKEDRVNVIMSVNLEDEVDVALGRAFCQEFAETNRTNTDVVAPPCSFTDAKAAAKDPPADLRSITNLEQPNVGFLMLTLSDQMVRGASDDRLVALARPVMTWRNFFHFHLKHTKSYLHSRLRRRLDEWQRQVAGTRRQKKEGAEIKRRMASGKEFAPQPRPAGGALPLPPQK